MYLAIPFVGALHVSRYSAFPSSRPPFVLCDQFEHGNEYTLGVGRWQAYFTPAASVRRSKRTPPPPLDDLHG